VRGRLYGPRHDVLAGLGGSGRTTIARALVGLARIDSGEVWLRGFSRALRNPARALRAGVALIPEDRKAHGLVLSHSVRFNITLPNLLRFGLLLLRRREAGLVQTGIERLGIRPPAPETPVENLSGGNQQKVALSRWLVTKPSVLILDEPTQGIDVGAKSEIHALMTELAAQGVAIVMISSELPEILGMSDRIAVMHGGTIVATLDCADATPQKILALALGHEISEIQSL